MSPLASDSNLKIPSVCLVAALTFLVGCQNELVPSKSLPAPLVNDFPYELEFVKRMRIWGGDNLEVGQDGVIHYLVLQGIDSPKPGQDDFGLSRKALVNLIQRDLMRVVVVGRDDLQREIAQLYLGDTNLNLEMARLGMVWWDGTEFDGSETIQQAVATARKKKIGIWKNPDAIHPSEWEED